MKSSRVRRRVLLVVAVLCCWAAAVPALALADGNIAGTMVDDTGGDPVVGACVGVLTSPGGALVNGTSTGVTGAYNVSVAAGTYKLILTSGPGCPVVGGDEIVEEHWQDKASLATADDVVVVEAQTTNLPNAIVTRAAAPTTGTISGTVTDSSPGPVQNVCVAALDQADGSLIQIAITDASGNYTIPNLPAPASYDVVFTSDFGCPPGADVVTEYYDNHTDPADADSVAVAAGADTPDIDAVVVQTASVPGGISGNVEDADGDPIGGVCVLALDGSEDVKGSTFTAMNGDYTLDGLPDGTYKVRFSTEPPCPAGAAEVTTEYFNEKATFATADDVVVSGAINIGKNAVLDILPVASDDTATVVEDSTGNAINVLANDADADTGDTVTVTNVSDPANGSTTISAGGSGITYSPDANYCNSGPPPGPADVINYTVNGGDTATVLVTVTCLNDNPVANDDPATVAEDASATNIPVLTNDSDAENDAIDITAVSDPANGTAAVVDGSPDQVSYAPDANYCNDPGAALDDTFTYTVNGGDTATVSVTVTCVNDDPVAVDDTQTVAEDANATNIPVLGNDTDPDGDAEITAVSDPANGTAAVVDGTPDQVSYTPDANYCNDPGAAPEDTFTYTLNGGDTGTVSVTVTCQNDDPVANDDPATVAEDASATNIPVLTNDTDVENDAIEITAASDPANGTAAVVDGSPDQVSYAPDANYCNDPGAAPEDTFTYTVNGGDTATVSVTVTCVDDNPVAVDDPATVAEDANATNIAVLTNDTDVENDAIQITAASDPANGTAAVVDGSPDQVSYAPDANYCNDPGAAPEDTFTYTVNGGDTATVSVTVTCADDAPNAVNDAATVAEDADAGAIDVLANDTDGDGGTKQVASVDTAGSHGAVAITGGGSSLTYKPDANFCGADSFKYTLNGGSQATVSVTVNCADDPPTAVADAATVTEDAGPTTIDVLANDTDSDGGGKTVESVIGVAANGTVSVAAGGSGLTYQPNADYCNSQAGGTPATFTYKLNGGSEATVSVTVTCVDEPVPAKLNVTISPTRATVVNGRVRLKVRCIGTAACRGTLRLRNASGRSADYGGSAFNVAAGKTKTVTIRANSKLRRLLAKKRRVAVRARARLNQAVGPPTTHTRRVTLVLPRRR